MPGGSLEPNCLALVLVVVVSFVLVVVVSLVAEAKTGPQNNVWKCVLCIASQPHSFLAVLGATTGGGK